MDTFLKISKSPKLVILAKMLILHFTVAVRACVAFLAKLRFFGDFEGLDHFGQIFETYGKEGIFDIFFFFDQNFGEKFPPRQLFALHVTKYTNL